MTPHSFKTAFDAQPVIAQKLLDFVPIQEAWPVNKIITAMVHAGISRVDVKTAEGCMNKLKDAGLVKEPERGIFQRRVPRDREAPKLEVCDVSHAPVRIVEVSVTEPTVVLGTLASALRHQATLLNSLADKIDESALDIEERIDVAEKRLSKYRELFAILKEE